MPVPDFSVGEVFTAAAADSIGLWRITTCTVSSTGGTAATASNGVITIGNGNTALTVSNAFSADFDNYLIRISGGGASGNLNGYLRMGTSTVATGYYAQLVFGSYANTSQAANINNGTYWDWAFSGNTNSLHGMIDLNGPFLSEQTIFRSTWVQSDTAGSNQGFLNNTTSYTQFNISLSTGSLTGGTIRVYGYRN